MAFLVIGAVSATEDNIGQDEFIAHSNNVEECQMSDGGSDALSDNSAGTLTELNRLIDNADENATITLDKDYANTYPQDIINKYGLTIEKSLTIEGNGHTIDAAGLINIFQITADNVVLNNITFINTNSTKSGGAIIWTGSNGVLNNSVFQDNAALDGAGVLWNGNNGTIINSVFVNNSAVRHGGAVFVGGTDNSIINSIFTSNSAAAGSAVYWNGKNGIVKESSFSDNAADSSDAIFESTKGNIIVNENNLFSGNEVTNEFARLFLNLEDGATVTLTKDWVSTGRIYINTNNLTINGNHHIIDANGTGVFYILSQNVTIRDITIQNAYDTSASAIIWTGINGLLENSCFINNSATATEGGAVQWRSVDGTIINSTFINNRVLGAYGGAVFMLDGTQFIYNSTFINNTANSYGGALLKGRGIVDGCVFYDNHAGQGGAIIVHDNNLTIMNSVFNNNTASDGASIFVLVSDSQINNCNFTNNVATSAGGAVWFRNDGYDNSINECNFINNRAKVGGAVDIQGTSVIITNSNFTNNTATNTGGAVSSRSEGSSIVGCNFTGNVATASGGAVHSTYNICIENDEFNEESDLVNLTNASLLYNGDFYISPDGTGEGLSINDCSNWNYALENIASGNTIYLTAGTYTSIINQTIGKTLNIVGLGNDVIIDLENNGRAFLIPTGNSTVSNITFINGYYFENEGGAIRWTGKYGKLTNSTFINNTGSVGAVYLGGYYVTVDNCNFINNTGNDYGAVQFANSAAYLSNSVFINNTAGDFNDANYRGGMILVNNTFYGSYINLLNNLVEGYNYVTFRVTPDNEDLTAQMYINNEFKYNYTVIANSTGNAYYYISGLDVGQEYEVDFDFISQTSNKYYNLESKSFKYLGDYKLYVSPNGIGNGTLDNPTNWSDAISTAPNGATIYLLDGNYTDIVLQDVISMNDINIIGSGNSIIESSTLGVLDILGDNVFVSNITFKSTSVNLKGNNIHMDNVKFSDCVGNSTHAIYWEGSNGILSNAEFDNCISNVSGPAIYWNGANGLLTDCTFTNCAVNNTGIHCGAVYWNGAKGKIKNSKFENCNATNYGGALYWNGGSGKLSNSTFTNCNAKYGGAIWWSSGQGTMYDCIFNSCVAGTDAGAVDWRGTEGMIYNTTFVNCSSTNIGAFDAIGSYNILYNCTFIDCNASSNGGAYRAISGSNNLVLMTNFINCHSNAHSGAIYANKALNIEHCTFINCSANTFGGAVTTQDQNNIISNSTFTNCSAKTNGGAICWRTEGGEISGCNFTDNVATGNSNDIYLEKSVTLKNNIFTGDYIDVPDYTVIYNIKDGVLKSTASNENTFVTIMFNDTGFEVNIPANNTGDISFVLKDIIDKAGVYTVTASFSDNINTYNVRSKNITVYAEAPVIYVEPYGTGDGSFENPANWDYALNELATYDSTIIFLEGTYYDVHGSAINEYIHITTNGSVVIDGQGKVIFTVVASNVSIANITFINASNSYGGAIYWTGANGTLINSAFSNCNASNNGGAIRWNGNNGSIINCNFTDCYTTGNDGGAIRWNGNNGTIINSIFANCSSNGYGSAIRTLDNGIVFSIFNCSFTECSVGAGGEGAYCGALTVMDGCNFTECKSNGTAAALRVLSSNAIIQNCIFKNTHSLSYGGAVDINNGVHNTTFRNCTFDNCTTTSNNFGGGAIHIRNSGNQNFTIVDCNFTNCNVPNNNGGAIQVDGGSIKNVTIANCNFINNSAKNAGAIWSSAILTSISNCTFIDNNAIGTVGAVYKSNTGDITDCNFINCRCDNLGGAIRLNANNANVTRCNFTNCYTTRGNDGGAVAIWGGSNVSLINCSFTDCYATGGYGGAVRMYNGQNHSAYNCSFTNCYVKNNMGGAIYISNSKYSVISGSNFTDCYSPNNGGAIFCSNSDSSIVDCNFNNCAAKEAGAVYLNSNNISVNKCTFIKCSSNTTSTTGGGGAIRMANNDAVSGSTFINCSSVVRGGAIIGSNTVNSSVFNCTFINCSSGDTGGGVYSAWDTVNSSVSNSTFIDCKSNNTGGAVYVGSGTTCYYNAIISTDGLINNKNGIAVRDARSTVQYNWYGNNTPDLTTVQEVNSNYLKVAWDKVYDPLVSGEWNGVLDVYFIKNDTGERVDVAWARTIIYDVISDNADVEGELSDVYGRLYTTVADETVVVKAKVDNQELNELVFGTTKNTGFSELENLIKGTDAGETLVLNNNYTYNPNDEELVNGIVIDKPITITLNGSAISGNNSAKNIFNITCNDVVLENMTLRDVKGTGIISTGNNTRVNNLKVENIKDTVIDIIADNADITNVEVSGEPNTVVNIKGNNPTVKNITSDTYESDLILIDGEGSQDSLNITVDDVTYPNKAQANISASVDGLYIITVNNKNYTVNVTDGKGTVKLNALSNGIYEAVVKSSMSTFNVTGTTEFTIYNRTIEYMNVSVDDVTYPDRTVVIVNAGVDGYYIVTVNNKTYNVKVINGTGSVTLDELLANNYTVDAVSNIHNYNIISNTTSFTVKGMDTNFTLEARELIENKVTEIPVDLPEDATGNVSVIINGEVVDTKELVNGSVILEIPELEAGQKYNVAVDYSGDGRYEGFNQNFVGTVKVDGDFNMTIPELYKNETAEVQVTLPDDATGNVSLIIDGEVIDTKEVTNCSVIMEIPGLTKGDHNITISYTGDDKYASQNEEFNVSVVDNIFISANDLTKYYSAPDKFAVNVTDCDGKPIVNKTVIITLNGANYKRTTDENGSAYMNINLGAGVYEVTVNVDNVTLNRNITILSTINGTDIVKIFRNGTQYYVTVKDANGNYLPEGSMIEFNINGVFYKRQVKGDEGLVKLNINLPEGEYIITATNLETKEAISNVITVLKNIISEDIVKYFKNGTQYCVTLLDDNGNPVGAGVNVTFNINGVFYTRQTNASGVAKLNINLPEGNYTITADYNGCLVSNNIEVLPVLIAEDLVKQAGTSKQFVARLLDGNGQPYKNQEVTFNINGVLYKRVTDSDGQAKLNINLPYGEYLITSSYNGCSVGNTITVTY